MSDESRSADGLIEAVAALRQELEDFKTTQNARTFRGPTGDIGHILSATPRPDTLFLDGQTVSRETYAALWAWAQGQGLAGTVFGNGDGSTTFVMPDLKGRVFVHQDAVTPVGTKFGADSLILTAAQMPVHTHTVNNHSNHNHPLTGGSVPSGGGPMKQLDCRAGRAVPDPQKRQAVFPASRSDSLVVLCIFYSLY